MPYLTRSAALTDYVEVARAVGVDPYRMLDEVSLPRACLRNPDLKISAGAVGRLLEATARVAGIDDFGLRLAERRVLSNLGPVGLIVREQPTVRKAIEALIQYMGLHSEAQSPRMEDAGDIVTVIVGLVIRRPAPMRQSIELSMGVLYRILRLFLGDAWKPKLICFTHRAPRNRDTYRRLFGIAHLRFSHDFNGIVCAARDLDAPIQAADPTMARYVQQYLDSIAALAGATISDKVRELIWMMLSSGNCSIERVAKHLGVDRRTVHRRLAREGTSFSTLLDAVRTETVTRFIENRDRPLYVVAEMSGFSAQSAFSRWFRSRFGSNVSAWREANLPSSRRL
jgi:AraC-like DNA-binding protein